MEQPTLFYAIALTLALMDMGHGINLWLAWGYVVFASSTASCSRPSTSSRSASRSSLWRSLCLLGLTVHAGARILHDCLGWELFVH